MTRSVLVLLAALVLALALAACAGPNANTASNRLQLTHGVVSLLESDPEITLGDPRIRCTLDRPVGSNLPMRTCMLTAEVQQRREEDLRNTFGTDNISKTLMGAGEGGQ